MGEIASIYARVGADMTGFRRGMNEMDSTIHKSGGAFRNFTTGIIQGMGQAFGQAAMRGIREFGDAMASTLKNAAGLEQGVADIAAVMGATAAESAELSKLITDLGIDPKLKVTAFEAAGAIEMLAKNGLNLEQIMGGAARSTVLLSNSTGGDFATSADVATSAMAQFKIEAKDMAGAVNQIVGVTKNSKFDINDYRLAISQAGGVAASVGVSFQDFNATIAAISPLFASGSDAGTSFKTFLQRLAPDTEPAIEGMRELGIITADGQNKFFTASGQMKSMSEIAQVLQESFGGLSEEQKILAATNIFGTDAMRAAFALADGGASAIDKFTAAIAKANAEQSAATRMDTLSGDWEIFQGILETISIQIGQKFLPAARGIVQWATQLATEKGPQLVAFFGRIADMLPGLGRQALSFFDMISGPGVTKTVSMLAQGFATLGRVLATLVRPFKEAFGGLMQQLSAMRTTGFADVFSVILHRIGQAISGFAKLIATEAVPFILKTLRNLWDVISDWVRGVSWDDIKGWAKAFWDWAVDLWGTLSPYLAAFWKELSSWVTDPAKRQQLWDGIVNGWNVFSQWAVDIWEWMKPGLIATWNFLSSWITDPAKRQQLWDGIVATWNVFADFTIAIWNWMAPGLLATWNYLSSWVTDPGKRQQLWDGVVTVWNVFADWAAAIWNWMSPHLAAAWGYLSSWVTDPAKRQQLWDGVVAGWNVFSEWALSIWNWVSPHLSAAWQSISSWATDPIKRQILIDTVKGWGTALVEWAGWLWNGGGGFEGLKIKLDRWWGDFVGWITTKFPEVTEPLSRLSKAFSELFAELGKTFAAFKVIWVEFTNFLDATGVLSFGKILAFWIDVAANFVKILTGLTKWLRGWLENDWSIIWQGTVDIIKGIGGIIDAMISFWWPDWKKAILDGMLVLASGFTGGLQSIVNAFNAVMDSFKKHVWAVMTGIGKDVIGGITEGIKGAAQLLKDALTWVTSAMPDWVKKALGIASPSKVFEAIGKQVTAGFAKGIGDSMSLPQLSVDSMVRHTVEAVPLGGITAPGSDGTVRRIELVVTGESALPADRAKLQELSRMLQREMGLGGARVAY